MPLLVLCRQGLTDDVDAVRSADEAAVAELVEHVLSSGRTDLVYVDGGTASSAELRADGYRRAMQVHGLAEPGGGVLFTVPASLVVRGSTAVR